MSVQWRPVPGWEGLYEVSDQGQVRSSYRAGRVMKPYRTPKGYLRVGLWKNGKLKMMRVHTLVMLAFVGPRPDGLQVCHGDGDPSNNHVSNLRYGTAFENALDRVRQTTHCRHGHEFTRENTYFLRGNKPTLNSRRQCRDCKNRRERERYAAARLAKAS